MIFLHIVHCDIFSTPYFPGYGSMRGGAVLKIQSFLYSFYYMHVYCANMFAMKQTFNAYLTALPDFPVTTVAPPFRVIVLVESLRTPDAGI